MEESFESQLTPKPEDSKYLGPIFDDFYKNHTFVGSLSSSNVLNERTDFVIKSFCYDAE